MAALGAAPESAEDEATTMAVAMLAARPLRKSKAGRGRGRPRKGASSQSSTDSNPPPMAASPVEC